MEPTTVSWEYRVFAYSRVGSKDEWIRAWSEFVKSLHSWEEVTAWLNTIGEDGWEILTVSEDFVINWEQQTDFRSIGSAKGEFFGSEQWSFGFDTSLPSINAARVVSAIRVYARRARLGSANQ
jgi:hypothetical protein